MPRVRIEWVPVQTFGLGHLGLDHLHLVFEPGEGVSGQDDWFVMEGVRDDTSVGTFLGIEGADGRTTLAMANAAARSALTEKIGTPELRGSRLLPYSGDEFRAWETMSSYARDIEEQDYPYIALGLPGSPTPTINSSSAVASLIHYSGLDPSQNLPFGMRMSPGTSTLLGTGDNDHLRAEHGFSTLLGGGGDDVLTGNTDRHTEKLFGGRGDDMFRWSPGFNIVHGGQPQLPYAADGTDVIDYAGAGKVTITFNRHWVPHKSPNFLAVHDHGIDHLFSIERIQWNASTDQIETGRQLNIIEDDRVLRPHAGNDAANRSARLLAYDDAVVGTASSGGGGVDRLIGSDADEVIDAMAGDDTLYGGGGCDTLIGGPGSDGYVYSAGDGHDVIIELEGDEGFDELLLAGGITPADVSAMRAGTGDLLLLVPQGSILVAGFFDGPGAGIERIVFDHGPPIEREALEGVEAGMPTPLTLVGGEGAGGLEGSNLDAQSWGGDDTQTVHAEAWPADPYILALF